MVQGRKPDGKFGGKVPEGTEATSRPKKTDIRKNDVDNAIRLVMDEVYVRVEIPRPMKMNVVSKNSTVHALGTAEFIVYAMLGISLTALAIFGTFYLGARI